MCDTIMFFLFSLAMVLLAIPTLLIYIGVVFAYSILYIIYLIICGLISVFFNALTIFNKEQVFACYML